ncbi:MAG: DUF2007 domain-containing protein [Chloroflexi bacterium]|nr:DUF2007 domain-containing protein [Chloroflexota bacterium]
MPFRLSPAMIWAMNENAIEKRQGPDRKTWYVVAYAASITDAEIPAGLLRSADIPVYLLREAINSALPLSVGLMGGVEIVVPEAYYEVAMALLDPGWPPTKELPGTGEEDAPSL